MNGPCGRGVHVSQSGNTMRLYFKLFFFPLQESGGFSKRCDYLVISHKSHRQGMLP